VVGGGEGLLTTLDPHGAVAPGCAHEFLDAPVGLGLDPVGRKAAKSLSSSAYPNTGEMYAKAQL